ncbi:hypothetical protein SDC9_68707 [bioreactor metagenome]|uniref:Uncharacterized protein n=1 Tax=bioreactor metagenome TaxID=1076179 RepID=A0A644Y177_9ZZZZ
MKYNKAGKRKRFIKLALICFVLICAILAFFLYRAYTDKLNLYPFVERQMMQADYDGLVNFQDNLTEYFFNHGKAVPDMKNLIDSMAAGIADNHERDEYTSFLQENFRDPWSSDSQLLRIYPVYDRVSGLEVGNIVLSAGIDGKINNCSTRFFSDEIHNSDQFYNASDYAANSMLVQAPKRVDYAFSDYLLGQRDFIYFYINYFEPDTFGVELFDFNHAADYFKSMLSFFNKTGAVPMHKDLPFIVSEISKSSVSGRLLVDTSYFVNSSLLSLPEKREVNELGDTVIISAKVVSIDTLGRKILMKNGILSGL